MLGARHFDGLMRHAIASRVNYLEDWRQSEQGFVDQHCVFYTREDAWVVACAAKQIRQFVGNQTYTDDGVYGAELFSENLY